MDDDDLERVTMSSLIRDPGVAPLVRGAYRPRKLNDGVVYLLAVGAMMLPPFGLVAIVLAVRHVIDGSRAAWLALGCALLGTSFGVALWMGRFTSFSS